MCVVCVAAARTVVVSRRERRGWGSVGRGGGEEMAPRRRMPHLELHRGHDLRVELHADRVGAELLDLRRRRHSGPFVGRRWFVRSQNSSSRGRRPSQRHRSRSPRRAQPHTARPAKERREHPPPFLDVATRARRRGDHLARHRATWSCLRVARGLAVGSATRCCARVGSLAAPPRLRTSGRLTSHFSGTSAYSERMRSRTCDVVTEPARCQIPQTETAPTPCARDDAARTENTAVRLIVRWCAKIRAFGGKGVGGPETDPRAREDSGRRRERGRGGGERRDARRRREERREASTSSTSASRRPTTHRRSRRSRQRALRP